MFHDPIVDEVRAIRERLSAQFDFDIRKIVEDAQRRQAKSKARIVSFQKPSTAPDLTGPPATVSENVTSH